MSIDRLSGLSAQLAALRAELSRKSGETRRRERSARGDDAQHAASAHERDPDALRSRLVEIVREVGADDADAQARRRERVVKAVLLWEFGQDIREHPEWKPMIETIAQTLGADVRMRADFDRLIADLSR